MTPADHCTVGHISAADMQGCLHLADAADTMIAAC